MDSSDNNQDSANTAVPSENRPPSANQPGAPTVMDVQRPPRPAGGVSIPITDEEPEADAADSEKAAAFQPETAPAAVPETAPAPAGSDQQPPALAASPAAKPHNAKPLGAVIAAVFIAVLLAAITVFAYFKTKSSVKPAATNTSKATTVQTSAATPQDVDKTTHDIDKSLSKVNDTQDFGSSDLSSQAVGL